MSNRESASLPHESAGEGKVSIVLVHGAFVDGSGWMAVHARLSARGYEVLVAQNPGLSLESDIAATERAIRMARYPVVLVGHSYGGAVVTEAGDHPQVRAVVYIAAFVPEAGESVALLNQSAAEPGKEPAPVLAQHDGFMFVDPARFPEVFGADVSVEVTRFMAAAQVPWGPGAAAGAVRRTAWKSKPTYYMVATADLMIPPTAQRRMARRAGASTVEIDCSHAAMLARPDEVAAFIATAAT